MKIKQHIPNFIEGVQKQTIEFENKKDLLEIEFVQRFTSNKKFHKLSISEEHLMAEYDKGYEWWVIGLIDGDIETLNLPKWKSKYRDE